jgi:arylformamidase
MALFDAERFNREYNNRTLVADSASLIEAWGTRSAQVRERLKPQEDIAYAAGERCVLDVFAPKAKRNCPVLFFIPGGWYRALSKRDYSFIAEGFVALGAVVVIPSYALAPQVSVSEIFSQMQLALEWTQTHIARFDGDASRITLAGHSAGGNLAALLACTEAARLSCKSALIVSGLMELESVRHTPFLQADLKLSVEESQRLSPARSKAPKLDVHMIVGADESQAFRDQTDLALRAWGKHCVQSVEHTPECNHFTIMDAFSDAAHPLHQRLAKLL